MIRELHIRNFAIIDEMAMELGTGLQVLTGETGAGKSIIIDALHLLLGGRATLDVIRSGAEEATVEAILDAPTLLQERCRGLGFDVDSEILVRRVLSRTGRNRVSLNGRPMTVGLLQEALGDLVDITGQHEHHTLLRTEAHLGMLDAAGSLGEMASQTATAFAELRELLDEQARVESDRRERAARQDYLAFQLREIAEARLQPGEDEELTLERSRLRNAQKLLEGAAAGEEALYAGDDAAASLLARVERELGDLGEVDPELAGFAQRLEAARLEIEDVAAALSRYTRSLEAEPDRLAEVEERLVLLGRLKRKYGGSVEEILSAQRGIEEELTALESAEGRAGELGARIKAAQARFADLCRSLSNKRRVVAKRLVVELGPELETLALNGCRFDVSFSRRRAEGGVGVDGHPAGPTGIDRVEFTFSPNPGEEPRPLARIASGGELSRVTLALKQVLVANEMVDTYVFDEVDAGIGGATAEVVGRKLKELSRSRQVLCITHLPQIAAFADRHFAVSKHTRKGRTVCQVEALGDEERKREIARMLGGVRITDRTRAHAEEMIRAAR